MTQTGINQNYGKVLYGMKISGEDIRRMEECFRQAGQLKEILDNPVISRKVKHRIIRRVFPESLHTFLMTVSDHRRMGEISRILDACRGYMRRDQGILTARLYCVSEPDREQYEGIREFVKKEYGAAEVELSVEKRPELIGGFILQVGDREYDWSLQGRIRQLEQNLIRR